METVIRENVNKVEQMKFERKHQAEVQDARTASNIQSLEAKLDDKTKTYNSMWHSRSCLRKELQLQQMNHSVWSPHLRTKLSPGTASATHFPPLEIRSSTVANGSCPPPDTIQRAEPRSVVMELLINHLFAHRDTLTAEQEAAMTTYVARHHLALPVVITAWVVLYCTFICVPNRGLSQSVSRKRNYRRPT